MIDEMAYVNAAIFKSVCVPILTMANTCFVGFSTNTAVMTNFFRKLRNSPSFKVVRGRGVCKKCEAKGVMRECPHEQRPQYHDASRLSFINEMMGDEEEDEATYALEMLGIDPKATDTQVFPSALIQELFAGPKVRFYSPVRYIFLGIDPCSGSELPVRDRPSDFAAVSIAWGPDQKIITGCESIASNASTDFQGRLLDHVNMLMNLPFCSTAKVVFDVEVGLGHMPADIAAFLFANVQHKNRLVEMGSYKNKQGRAMSFDTKVKMAHLTETFLKKRQVAFYENFVTTHEKPNELLTDFCEQLKGYTRLITETARGNLSVKYSGKKGKRKDDLAVTFQRTILAMSEFWDDAKRYSKHWT